jgi:hypothetical protein
MTMKTSLRDLAWLESDYWNARAAYPKALSMISQFRNNVTFCAFIFPPGVTYTRDGPADLAIQRALAKDAQLRTMN